MKSFLFLILFLFVGHVAHAETQWFSDVYLEGNYLGRSKDMLGFGHLRFGRRFNNLEVYGAFRGSTDTKSETSPLGQIYNDNFFFTGFGIDYVLPFIPGFRLRGQIGKSFNLLDRTDPKEGFDFQTDVLTYHEGYLGTSKFSYENYSEFLYVRRYHNLLMGEQFRLLYRQFETQKGTLVYGAYPTVMGVVGFDSNAVFYNRFLDLRTGIRFQARTRDYVFFLTPEWITGTYLAQNHSHHTEFRLLAVIYAVLF